MSDATKGGFHIGSVGGNASFNAGGDMVAGDKITQTTTTTISNGFDQDDDKQKFLQQIDELRTTLREIQANMAEAPGLGQEVKDEIAAEVLQQVNALKKVQDEAAALPVAKQPSPGSLNVIKQGLENTGTIIEKVTNLCDKAARFGEKVQPYITKALPILLTARHLFGLP
jgi:hypothetical protein